MLHYPMLAALAKGNDAELAQLNDNILKNVKMIVCANAVSYNTVTTDMYMNGARDGVNFKTVIDA
eukprot:5308181-Ditylum_brightwellii.AAC.1